MNNSKERRIIENLHLDLTNQAGQMAMFRVAVQYSKGNYLNTNRGYEILVMPYFEKDGMETFIITASARQHIESAKRFSEKRLNELAANIKSNFFYRATIEACLQTNNVKLKDTTGTAVA